MDVPPGGHVGSPPVLGGGGPLAGSIHAPGVPEQHRSVEGRDAAGQGGQVGVVAPGRDRAPAAALAERDHRGAAGGHVGGRDPAQARTPGHEAVADVEWAPDRRLQSPGGRLLGGRRSRVGPRPGPQQGRRGRRRGSRRAGRLGREGEGADQGEHQADGGEAGPAPRPAGGGRMVAAVVTGGADMTGTGTHAIASEAPPGKRRNVRRGYLGGRRAWGDCRRTS